MGGTERRIQSRRARCGTQPTREPKPTHSADCMNPAVYDAGALVAADRNERSTWAEHRVRLEAGVIPSVPAPVVAQVSRSARQARLRRFLRGCDVVDFREVDAHAAGRLLARSRTSDVVDAAVVVLAMDRT